MSEKMLCTKCGHDQIKLEVKDESTFKILDLTPRGQEQRVKKAG